MRSFKAIEVHILSGHYFDKVFYMNTANCKCVCYTFYERYQSQYCKNVVQHHVYPTKIQGTWGRRGMDGAGGSSKGAGEGIGWALSPSQEEEGGEGGLLGGLWQILMMQRREAPHWAPTATQRHTTLLLLVLQCTVGRGCELVATDRY